MDVQMFGNWELPGILSVVKEYFPFRHLEMTVLSLVTDNLDGKKDLYGWEEKAAWAENYSYSRALVSAVEFFHQHNGE